jgi:hypothetical protein
VRSGPLLSGRRREGTEIMAHFGQHRLLTMELQSSFAVMTPVNLDPANMKMGRPWTASDLERLKLLASQGASAARAAAALDRRITSVRSQARRLGTPFPTVRATRRRWQPTADLPR